MVLYLISILTDRINRDEIYLRKVSLLRVTGERIPVVLQFFAPQSFFFFLILVQKELLYGSPQNLAAAWELLAAVTRLHTVLQF